MSFQDKKPGYEKVGDETTLYEKIKQTPEAVHMVPTNSGVFHTNVLMKNLNFKLGDGESVIEHAGSYITFGRDRPGTLFSGFGARGVQNASTIDIVVGRGASARKGKGVANNTVVQNMFSADAARIYISQLTKIDKNFGIASGVPGKHKPASGIGIKADDVRIIARSSFKLCTGRADGVEGHGQRGETNSLGGKSSIAPTIELIAGNYSDSKYVYGGLFNPIETVPYLQHAVKGDNLVKALTEMNEIMGNIWSAVYNMGLLQTSHDAINGIDGLRPWVAAMAPTKNMGAMYFVLMNLWAARVKGTMWEQYYLDPSGYRYINSPNVYLT